MTSHFKSELPWSLLLGNPNVSRSAPWPLSEPLCRFTSTARAFTIGDAVKGVQIFGGTGSGKTSGSGKLLAKSYLKAGFGGLVLCAKKDEFDLWKALCAETGRSDSLIEFGIKSKIPLSFKFLEYTKNNFKESGEIYNIVKLIKYTMDGLSESSSSQEDQYWAKASNQLLSNMIAISLYCDEPLTFDLLARILKDVPRKEQDFRALEEAFSRLEADNIIATVLMGSMSDEMFSRDLRMAKDYFTLEFESIPERARGTIISYVSSMIDSFLRDPLYSIFSNGYSIDPEWIFSGGILVVNISVHEFDSLGLVANLIWKYLFQKAAQKRSKSGKIRPVFLWADEAHYFVTREDSEFQTTARSQLVATVYISQNLANYRMALGSGASGSDATTSLLGNLSTKIYHLNADPETNRHAAGEIGKGWFRRPRPFEISEFLVPQSKHEHPMRIEINDLMRPEEFSNLRDGGKRHLFAVDAIIFVPGRKMFWWRKDFAKCTFLQRHLFERNRIEKPKRRSVDFNSYLERLEYFENKVSSRDSK